MKAKFEHTFSLHKPRLRCSTPPPHPPTVHTRSIMSSSSPPVLRPATVPLPVSASCPKLPYTYETDYARLSVHAITCSFCDITTVYQHPDIVENHTRLSQAIGLDVRDYVCPRCRHQYSKVFRRECFVLMRRCWACDMSGYEFLVISYKVTKCDCGYPLDDGTAVLQWWSYGDPGYQEVDVDEKISKWKLENREVEKARGKRQLMECEGCGRFYKGVSGLSKHRKSCKQ